MMVIMVMMVMMVMVVMVVMVMMVMMIYDGDGDDVKVLLMFFQYLASQQLSPAAVSHKLMHFAGTLCQSATSSTS